MQSAKTETGMEKQCIEMNGPFAAFIPAWPFSIAHRRMLTSSRSFQCTAQRTPRTTAEPLVPRENTPTAPVPSEFVWNPTAKPGLLAAGLRTVPEVTEDISVPVTGKIPSYVDGRLFRNGPGIFEVTHKNGDTTQFNHWFDGIATVHRFRINGADGTVSYKNRRTMPEVLEAAENANSKSSYKSLLVGEQDPCRGLLGTMFQMWRPFSKAPRAKRAPVNVSVTLEDIPGIGKLTTRTDTNVGAVLDIDSLENKGRFTFADLNPALGKNTAGAHGVRDPDTGEYFNYCFSLGRSPTEYTVFGQSTDGETRTLGRFKYPPCYVHSLAATKNYVIMIMQPLVINPLKVLTGDGFIKGMGFERGRRTRFYVLSRAEERVCAVYESDAFFFFHTINAFERADGGVHIDLPVYADDRIFHQLYREHIAHRPAAFFDRPATVRVTLADVPAAAAAYAVDPRATAEARMQTLSDADIELPRVAPRYRMRDYRYAYGVHALPDRNAFNSLVKIDVASGEHVAWTPPSAACGEPIFVPKPGSTVEDEGVLLSVVLDAAEERSFLQILDAQTMKEVARADLPQAVPLGFHGQYMDEEVAMSAQT